MMSYTNRELYMYYLCLPATITDKAFSQHSMMAMGLLSKTILTSIPCCWSVP
uniref:Uncharacterized protein n=1 Tax=Arundo donax TaxID=35708 RepID=A0A0A9HJF1_ARUDO